MQQLYQTLDNAVDNTDHQAIFDALKIVRQLMLLEVEHETYPAQPEDAQAMTVEVLTEQLSKLSPTAVVYALDERTCTHLPVTGFTYNEGEVWFYTDTDQGDDDGSDATTA